METHNILFYSHNGPIPAELRQRFEKAAVNVTTVRSFGQVATELADHKYDLYLDRSDAVSETQVDLIRELKARKIASRIILSAKSGLPDEVVRARKAGAADVVIGKQMDSTLFDSVLANLDGKRLSDSAQADAWIQAQYTDDVLVGKSKAMQEVFAAIDMVSNSHTSVLISGEHGTGKELIARAIHLKSDRANRPFIVINCAGLPADVVESELFGKGKESASGPVLEKAGCLELANGGTLYFKEIAEMNPAIQAKLLRVLERKTFRRIGGNVDERVDVRMIAATSKSVRAALKSGDLREDLYFRFSVIEIGVPPLRDRKDDIPLLVEHFLSDFKQKYTKPDTAIADDALEAMRHYDWPGNVRELRNSVERMVMTCTDGVLTVSALPAGLRRNAEEDNYVRIQLGTTVHDAEKLLIEQTLAFSHNNKSKAARVLGVSRKTLHNKLSEYRLS